MRHTFYGGPMDGAEVPKNMTRQDFLLIEKTDSNNNSVVYYYEKCEQHPYFEFAGEVVNEDDDE